ncbi:sensor histidine kinase [Streptomyces sp. SCSIO 30461]|uniref:sensor histidine kinase n=1 Tax=Streptomyces sp. SCSIO 30461 TaxID=3118085 RepID=UPI00387EE3CC
MVERIIHNLLENAVRYNGPHGWVRLTTGTAPDGGAALTVENTGPVVADQDVDALFQPFRRLAAERTDSERGSGLGLAIVRAIAHSHGGEVTAHPRKPTSRHFPCSPGEPPASEPQRPWITPEGSRSGERVVRLRQRGHLKPSRGGVGGKDLQRGRSHSFLVQLPGFHYGRVWRYRKSSGPDPVRDAPRFLMNRSGRSSVTRSADSMVGGISCGFCGRQAGATRRGVPPGAPRQQCRAVTHPA